MKPFEIRTITLLPPQISKLEAEAVGEGFRFLTRLITQWESGVNRFDAPGECLMAAYQGPALIGIGGLSIDPYLPYDTARLRRVYVAPPSRGQRVGRALVEALVEHASERFRIVRLNADTLEADTFYTRCGFKRLAGDRATHYMLLDDARFK